MAGTIFLVTVLLAVWSPGPAYTRTESSENSSDKLESPKTLNENLFIENANTTAEVAPQGHNGTLVRLKRTFLKKMFGGGGGGGCNICGMQHPQPQQVVVPIIIKVQKVQSGCGGGGGCGQMRPRPRPCYSQCCGGGCNRPRPCHSCQPPPPPCNSCGGGGGGSSWSSSYASASSGSNSWKRK